MIYSRKSKLKVLVAAIAVVAFFIGGYELLHWIEASQSSPEARGNIEDSSVNDELLLVEGITYKPRKRLTTILLIGVDQDTTATTEHVSYQSGGQADFLRLLVIDETRQMVTQIPIDRDTITPITILSVLGKEVGTRDAQICLSHSFGDGHAQSCELSVKAVSNLLLGISIDYYIALNMNGVPALNDWAGGVTVTLEDDFSQEDPSMTVGKTIRLQGSQAEIFVRGRRSIGNGTNESRMKRQQVFLDGLTNSLKEKISQNREAIGDLYDDLGDYMVTNISRGRIINTAWDARNMTVNTLSIDGEHQVGDKGYMEFHADEQSIQSIVLNTFYQSVD